MKLKHIVVYVTITLVVFFLSQLAMAEINRLSVGFDLGDSDICTCQIHEALSKVKGVDSISINNVDKEVELVINQDENIKIGKIPQAVEKSGFVLRFLAVEATGTLSLDENKGVIIRAGDSKKNVYRIDLNGENEAEIRNLAEIGSEVLITGYLTQYSDKEWKLSPEHIKRITN